MSGIGVASPCHPLTPSPVSLTGLKQTGLAAGRNLYPCTRQVDRQQRSEIVTPDCRPSELPTKCNTESTRGCRHSPPSGSACTASQIAFAVAMFQPTDTNEPVRVPPHTSP